MQHAIKPFTSAALFVLLFIAGVSIAVQAQQGAATGVRKKVLFLTYPGVGAPGSHGHPSLPPAEEQAVEYGKVGGFDVTTLKGYEPGVGKQDLSFFTPAYLNQFDGLMMMANGDIGMTPVQKKAIVDFVRSGKAFIGVHCATVMMYDFPEYGEMLGAYYFNSMATPLLGNDVPVNQRRVGVLKVEDNDASGDADVRVELAGRRGVLHVRDGAVERDRPRARISRRLETSRRRWASRATACTSCSASIPSARTSRRLRRARTSGRAATTRSRGGGTGARAACSTRRSDTCRRRGRTTRCSGRISPAASAGRSAWKTDDEPDHFAALIESTWMVLVFASSDPVTWTFWPANFFSSVLPFRV